MNAQETRDQGRSDSQDPTRRNAYVPKTLTLTLTSTNDDGVNRQEQVTVHDIGASLALGAGELLALFWRARAIEAEQNVARSEMFLRIERHQAEQFRLLADSKTCDKSTTVDGYTIACNRNRRHAVDGGHAGVTPIGTAVVW